MKRLLFALICLLCVAFAEGQQSIFYDADRLPSSLITTMTQDADGLLWVGTEQGLSSFDGYSFTFYRLTHERRWLQSGNNVSSLLVDDNGRLWVGTAAGLLLRDRATGQFLPVHFPDSVHPRVSSLIQLNDRRILAGTSGYGLYTIDADAMQANRLNGYAPDSDNDYYSRIYEASDGTVWKNSPSGKVSYRTKSGQVRQIAVDATAFYERDGQVHTLTPPYTSAVTDADGRVFIGTRNNGLLTIPVGATDPQAVRVTVEGIALDRAQINTLYIDRDGRLWVGCYGRGLLMLRPNDPQLFQRWSLTRQGYQTGTCVTSIAEGTDGMVWCVVQGDGVYGFDRTGRIIAHPASPGGVETLMRDADNNFFLGTNDALYSYDPLRGSSRMLVATGKHWVNTMAVLDDNNLAVSVFGTGFMLVDKQTGHVVRHYTMHDTDTTGRGRLCNDWIYSFDKDRRGRLWMGTASGVSCFDPASGSFRTEGWNVLRDSEPCTALRILRDGGLRMAGQLPVAAGITFIAEDKQGDVWVAATDGLYRFGPSDTTAVAPLLHTEFTEGAGLQTSDGRIILGTADGLLAFHPDSVRARRSVPAQVHLTALRMGSEVATTMTRSGRRVVMKQPVMDCHEFSFSYIDATFKMEFSLLDFADETATTFQYRMEDDSIWQQIPEGQNAVIFNHLAPGKYQLQVRALTAGISTPVEVYIIEVRPPWWRSTVAYLIYFLLFGLFVAVLAWAYRRHLQNQADRDKLHLLLSAIHAEDTPLTADDMRKAISAFVQNRQRTRNTYGNTSVMADRIEAPAVRSDDEALMDRIVQSVNRHLSDSEFTTEQLCEEVALSRAQLHRKMKELTGMPASEFIRGIRLEQAARLLRERKLGIAQVAYSVGFATAGHFSTVFKKQFGVTPTQYVEQGGKKSDSDE